MPLRSYMLKVEVDPLRYHIRRKKNDNMIVVSASDKSIKNTLKQVSYSEACSSERCLLCYSYGLAKMPPFQVGEYIAFTESEEELYGIRGIAVVLSEFDPYDRDINSYSDLVSLGFIEELHFIELCNIK